MGHQNIGRGSKVSTIFYKDPPSRDPAIFCKDSAWYMYHKKFNRKNVSSVLQSSVLHFNESAQKLQIN